MSLKERFARVHVGQAAILSVVVALFFPLIVPFQTFIANKTMFDFGAGEVLLESLPVAFAIGITTFAVLIFSEAFLGRALHVLVTAVLVCEYFETGFFSIGLPPLDGELRSFQNPFRVLIDSGLLAFVFLLVISLYKWTKRWCHFIALIILVMSGASLLDVRPVAETKISSPVADGFCPQYDIVMSTRFSPTRNVILLILDSYRSTMASKTMRDHPELQQHFPGFVAYENNFAMHEQTARGLPGLITGKYLEPEISANAYSASIFGRDSLIIPYVEKHIPVYFSDQMLRYGYTNRRLGDYSNYKSNLVTDGAVFFRNSTGIPYISLFDTVKFRLAPYRNKSAILARSYGRATQNKSGVDRKGLVYNEDQLYPRLLNEPLSTETNSCLAIFHTTSVHGPITRDRNGKQLPSPSQRIEDYEDYSIFVMRQLASFMDGLKEKGIYDSSFIVLAADHGLIDESMASGNYKDAAVLAHHGADHSILWVKPIGGKAPFSFSRIPTSNCKVSELIKTLANKNLSQEESAAILKTSNRRFIAKHGTEWYTFGRAIYFYEWRYDDDGNVISCENKGVYRAN